MTCAWCQADDRSDDTRRRGAMPNIAQRCSILDANGWMIVSCPCSCRHFAPHVREYFHLILHPRDRVLEMQQRCLRSGLPTSDCLKLSRQPRRVVWLPRRAALQTLAMKTPDGPSVAIVGVSGAVGQEFLRVCAPACQSGRSCVSNCQYSRVPVPASGGRLLMARLCSCRS